MHHFVSDDGKLAVPVVKTSETLIFHNEDYSQNISSIIDTDIALEKNGSINQKSKHNCG